DVRDRTQLAALIERDAVTLSERLVKARLFARTITVKVRLPDFTTFTRSQTLNGATDRADVIARVARDLVFALDLSEGVRLLGVGVASFTEVAQEALFEPDAVGVVVEETSAAAQAPATAGVRDRRLGYAPGADVVHETMGPGWVWGSGLGRVTVRFETADTGPGPVRTLALDDPALRPADEPTDASP
ncbi:MAG TPA: DNA polymerase IV, partial [Propioniciclava tarda]|nr:DNA polymerase IV [Propioniciclava tarda]